jgi:RNA polymerase sigma-70 factor (ECF subfamily)
LRAAQMSYGVMLLLDRLKPEERAAFVLHEAFDCEYAEIAKILGKSPANWRQIVHRAKRRLTAHLKALDEREEPEERAHAPAKRVNPAEHARVVERLRAALNAQDRDSLVRLFCDLPEVVGETLEPVCADAIATRVIACVSPLEQTETVQIDGMRFVALLREGEIDALVDVSVEAGKIVALRVLRNAALLQRANGLYGRAAVKRLLQQIGRLNSLSIAMRRDFPVDIDA